MALSALHSSGLGSGDSRERRSAGYGGFDGFSEFVRARQQDLVRAAYLVCGDLAEAEDIVQGALVKLAGRWSSVADGHPDAYVRRIIYRDPVSFWRRRRAQRQALTRWAISRADTESRARVTRATAGTGKP